MRLRRLTSVVLAAVAAISLLIGTSGTPVGAVGPAASTVAVIGDTPYGPTKLAEFPALVAKINADPAVGLVTHLGDIKSGSTVCSDAYFAQVRALFDTFADPLVYTPGDNEWTDCHRANNGAYFPLDRLAAVRRTFFPVPGQTLGVTKRSVLPQAALPGFADYVENTLWTQSGATFAAVNIPGSNNDQVPWTNVTPAQAAQQPAEVRNRTAADLAWISGAFTTAIAQRSKGVVLAIQADMWDTAEADLTGYDRIVQVLALWAQVFKGPILVLEGDSHVFRVDKPLTVGDPLYARHPVFGLSAPNVTRIVVEGSTNPTEYLRLTVDPATKQVFSWVRVPL